MFDRVSRWVLLAAAGCVLAGCVSPTVTSDRATLGDPAASITRRISAVERLGAAGEAAPLRRAAWARRGGGVPTSVRAAAVDAWLELDPDAAWAELDAKIFRLDTPAVAVFAERAVRLGRRDVVPALLRAWAEPSVVAESDRPEPRAIVKICSDRPVDDFLMDVLHRRPIPGVSTRLSHEVAAWAVLMKRRDSSRSALGDAAPDTGLTGPLREAAAVLDRLPATRHEVLALWRLREAEAWAAMLERAGGLSPEQRKGLAVRHLPVLVAADAAGVHAGPAATLNWPDTVTLATLRGALTDPAVVAAAFEQADTDHADATTEHGGLLLWNEARGFDLQPYAAAEVGRDVEYVAPRALLRDLPAAVAHYHFHASSWEGAEAAAPGLGDRRLADRLGFNGLLLTPLDRNTLRATYYAPGGVQVDLTDLRR